MKSKLYIVSDGFQRSEFPLDKKEVLVGRGSKNHIRINDPSISRSHLKILRRDKSYFIVDLGSRNGTLISGKRLPPETEVPVVPGRQISLGNVLVTIGRVYEEDGLISQYMIDLTDEDLDTEQLRLLKDRRITDRENLEAIYEISSLLLQSLDLRELLERLTDSLFSSLDAIDTMAIVMLDSESGELLELASRSKFPKGDPGALYSLTVARRSIEEMKAVIMADTELEEEQDISESMEFKRIKSVMCVPFIRKSRAMGAMYVHSVDKPFGFRKSDLHLLTSLSGTLAVAIENALLFQKYRTSEAALRKAHDELEDRVKQRTLELSRANELLAKEIEERKRTEAALKEREETLRKRSQELVMRYKQVYCLYAVSKLKGRPGADLETILQGITGLLPQAFQYPDITCARLTCLGAVYISAYFKETEWTMKMPVNVNGKSAGHLEIFYSEERPDCEVGPFLLEEQTLLQVIADQTGETIELKQAEKDLASARKREIEIGSKIQETLLFGSPPTDINGIRMAALTVPSQGIDGDFCEFITLSNNLVDVILGDVMGKGVPAALLGAGTKGHFLKALNSMMSPSCDVPRPMEIVQKVHDLMVEELIKLEAFVTLTYARFDLDRNRLDFVDCGHPRILQVKASSKKVRALEGRNVPLGFLPDETYTQDSVTFENGDLFFFYSDGITEARDRKGRFFGLERLARCLGESAFLSVEQILDRVKKAVTDFSGTSVFSDDLTCVAAKIGYDHDVKPLAVTRLDLENSPDELERLRDFAHNVCTGNGLESSDEDTIWQVWIALHEAVSNIMKHAYGPGKTGSIQVESETFDDEWVFFIHHRGKPFKGVDAPKLPLSPIRGNGFGLIIIDRYMDDVKYTSSPDGISTVRLTKKRNLNLA